MSETREIIGTSQLQDVCDQISGEIDAVVTIFADQGEIIASSRRSRIGDRHAGAASVMAGEANFLAVSAEDASKDPTSLEGYLLPIEFEGRREFCVSIAASLELARTYCRVVQLWVLALVRERALTWSEARFRDVAESAGDWIWEMDENLRFSYLSPRFFDVFQIPPHSIIGKTRTEFASSRIVDASWTDHEVTLAARLPFREFAYSTVSDDGRTRHFKVSGKPIYDASGAFAGYRGTGYDNTEQVEMKAALERSQQLLFDAIDTIPEGFSLYDEDDRLVVFNNRYLALLYPDSEVKVEAGMSFEAIVRQTAESGFVPEAEGRTEDWVQERLARRRDRREPHIQQRGTDRWIMVSEHKTRNGGTVALYSDVTDLKQREAELANKSQALERLSSQLAKYLSPQVYESIFTGRNEVKVASQRKKLTVLFSDIAGFTEITDRLESEELTRLLNQYLTEMSRIALDHGATIDKYVGDAIMIFFGDPETQGTKQDALACVNMAIAMRNRLQDLNRDWRNEGIESPLQCRIGINTGFCTVGNFGSEDRMDYTIIGSGVNLASRLETAAEPGQILISYETYALVREEIECREQGRISVKGLPHPITTYDVRRSVKHTTANSGAIRARHPNLKLDLDLEAMSSEQASEAKEVLRDALDRLSNLE